MGISLSSGGTLGKVVLGLVVLLAAAQGIAGADIIYDNGGPIGWDACFSDYGPTWSGFWMEAADNFTLDEGSSVITDVHWWGYYLADTVPDLDDFTINFYEADGGPGSLIASYDVDFLTRTGIGPNPSGWEELYEYGYYLSSPLTLTPGTSYYISIVNNTYDESCSWYWNSTYNSHWTGSFGSQNGGAWDNYTYYGEPYPELAFRLTGNGGNTDPSQGVVPEPATLSLVGMGLSAGLVRRLRKRA